MTVEYEFANFNSTISGFITSMVAKSITFTRGKTLRKSQLECMNANGKFLLAEQRMEKGTLRLGG